MTRVAPAVAGIALAVLQSDFAAAQVDETCHESGFIPQGALGPLTAPNISIVKADPPPAPVDALRSPDAKRVVWAENPETMRDGPWAATMFAAGAGTEMRLTADNVRGGLNPIWINEHIVYLRVAFGRIYFADLIVDVDKVAFVHAEDVIYGCLDKPALID